MKLVILSFLFSTLALAQPDPEIVKQTLEKSGSCENFVRFDDANIYLGFGAYRRGFENPRKVIPSSVRVVPLGKVEDAFSLSTADSVIDSVRVGNSLFALTYSGIEEWDLTSRARVGIYPTNNSGSHLDFKEHAEAFARAGDKLVIAHGRLGVSIFDLGSRRVTNQFRLVESQNPQESMATGVAVVGNLAYVTMDNFTLVKVGKAAFRGIVVLDLNSETVVKEFDGMDPFANAAASDGKKLLVSFDGETVWKYGLDSLTGSALPEPEYRAHRFPANGHPLGRASVDEKYYYSCYSLPPQKPGQPYKLVPVALDRKANRLD